jgi:hypothetical protein
LRDLAHCGLADRSSALPRGVLGLVGPRSGADNTSDEYHPRVRELPGLHGWQTSGQDRQEAWRARRHCFHDRGCEAIGERHFGDRDYQESARQREAEASGDPQHTWPGPQWEYRVEMFKNPSAWVQHNFMSPEDMQERLGRFGAFGWELVSVTSTVKTRVDASNDLILIFKRPVLPEA